MCPLSTAQSSQPERSKGSSKSDHRTFVHFITYGESPKLSLTKEAARSAGGFTVSIVPNASWIPGFALFARNDDTANPLRNVGRDKAAGYSQHARAGNAVLILACIDDCHRSK